VLTPSVLAGAHTTNKLVIAANADIRALLSARACHGLAMVCDSSRSPQRQQLLEVDDEQADLCLKHTKQTDFD
jgi:hypothetical protein